MNVTMYNTRNNVVITTSKAFKKRWETLGFVEVKNLVSIRVASLKKVG